MPRTFKDRYVHLIGRRALVTGIHPKKGQVVDINKSAGNGLLVVTNVGSQWVGTINVNQLLDPE
jgi:hypothetical protein